MLGHDQQRIRLALALTMALPGTPVLLYGDEIGMGEDLSLSGRLAVRNPMQWSPEQAGGFSTSDALYRPAHAEGPYGYRTVNVADQRHDPGSLHSWVAQAIRVRRESPELGWGKWRTLDVDDPHVLAIETRWRDDRTVTLHNLSAEPAKVRLPDDAEEPGHGQPMRQMLGDTDPPYSQARRSLSAGTASGGCARPTDRSPPTSQILPMPTHLSPSAHDTSVRTYIRAG
jgi:maltose alpha-D-glucosyltransferase/alpha-amylase